MKVDETSKEKPAAEGQDAQKDDKAEIASKEAKPDAENPEPKAASPEKAKPADGAAAKEIENPKPQEAAAEEKKD